MAANLVPPDALKAIKPYLTLATQLDQKNEKAVAYYLRAYSVQNAMTINKSAPECKKFLVQLMDILEATKAQNRNDEAIKSEVVGQTCVEEFALKIFEKADTEDRQGNFNKNLVKQFYSAGLVFDCLNYFGELSEDLVSKKQYAKHKAMYLNKCFQTGETPIAGPLTGEDDGTNYDQSQGYTTEDGASSNFSPQKPNTYESTYNDNINRPGVSPTNIGASKYPVLPEISYNQEPAAATSSSSLPADALQKAQKHCKFATSALQYEDIPTAITNLEQCLRILKTGK